MRRYFCYYVLVAPLLACRDILRLQCMTVLMVFGDLGQPVRLEIDTRHHVEQ